MNTAKSFLCSFIVSDPCYSILMDLITLDFGIFSNAVFDASLTNVSDGRYLNTLGLKDSDAYTYNGAFTAFLWLVCTLDLPTLLLIPILHLIW